MITKKRNPFILIAVLLVVFWILYAFIPHKAVKKYALSDNANFQNDCGPQALLFLLKEFNIDTSLKDIEIKAKTDTQGTTMLGLKKAAENYGLKAVGMRLSYDELLSYVRPGFGVIAFINGNHYVYVKHAYPRGVVYKDVTPGFQFTRMEQWNAMWHGICLVISKEQINGFPLSRE